ncbi:MAG TPA: cytochrome c oxidase subunit 3 [Candidatus Sulfotelmatobacter sp.]|jgi:cytochrome c oxidase subunit 3|nr:cytochrome c oxidase subunit 3 [Candidatus Sulfotelmatobacter sp.]
MATYSPSTPANRLGRGGDVPVPPSGGNGGDNSQGSNFPNYGARLRRARLGLICGIATVSMVFISLTSAYVVRQGLPTFDGATNSYVRDWGQVQLPWLLLAINTALLLVSSLTMELARRDIKRRAALAPLQSMPGISLGEDKSFPWLGATVLLGFAFLVGQWLAWAELKARGFFVDTNPNSSFVYLLTAAHAVHLAGGIIALIWASVTSLLHRPVESRRIVVDVTGWYWHFMAVLWIYVFALLGLAR